MTDEHALAILRAVCSWIGDEDEGKRQQTIDDTAAKVAAGESVMGWGTLATHMPREVVAAVRTWLDCNDKRPAIRLASNAVHRDAAATIAALAIGAPALYQREGELVHAVRATTAEEVASQKEVRAGAPRLRRVSAATLRAMCTAAARYERMDGRSKEWAPTSPTDHVLGAVLDAGEYPGVRRIVGVVEVPFMGADGTVVDVPGFDEASGFLYHPSNAFLQVPQAPTQAAARAALGELSEVWCDFPFVDDAARAVPVAGVLTCLARPAFGAVPAFVFDANTRGSGKSLLVHSVYRIVTGRDSPVMTWPKCEEELEKMLAGLALAGAALANFDNVKGQFGGAPLDKCLTATDTVQLRILGRNDVPTLPWRTVLFGSGNGFEVVGDTRRRTLCARIESPLERPETRTGFKHPELLHWIGENRPRLVRAALTVLRGYVVAGKPDMGTGPWGSYEEWSALVPGAIRFAGGADVLVARPSMVDDGDDPEKAALAVVLEKWAELGSVTAKQAWDVMYSGMPTAAGAEIRAAIETQLAVPPGRQFTTRQLGDYLRRNRGRVVGCRALRSESGGKGVQRWRVGGSGG